MENRTTAATYRLFAAIGAVLALASPGYFIALHVWNITGLPPTVAETIAAIPASPARLELQGLQIQEARRLNTGANAFAPAGEETEDKAAALFEQAANWAPTEPRYAYRAAEAYATALLRWQPLDLRDEPPRLAAARTIRWALRAADLAPENAFAYYLAALGQFAIREDGGATELVLKGNSLRSATYYPVPAELIDRYYPLRSVRRQLHLWVVGEYLEQLARCLAAAALKAEQAGRLAEASKLWHACLDLGDHGVMAHPSEAVGLHNAREIGILCGGQARNLARRTNDNALSARVDSYVDRYARMDATENKYRREAEVRSSHATRGFAVAVALWFASGPLVVVALIAGLVVFAGSRRAHRVEREEALPGRSWLLLLLSAAIGFALATTVTRMFMVAPTVADSKSGAIHACMIAQPFRVACGTLLLCVLTALTVRFMPRRQRRSHAQNLAGEPQTPPRYLRASAHVVRYHTLLAACGAALLAFCLYSAATVVATARSFGVPAVQLIVPVSSGPFANSPEVFRDQLAGKFHQCEYQTDEDAVRRTRDYINKLMDKTPAQLSGSNGPQSAEPRQFRR